MRAELEEIKKIRVRNNDFWLEIMDIALRHAPEETKAIMDGIRRNDILIAGYVGDILEDRR